MVPTRFAVAAHILLLLATDDTDQPVTSNRMASSINTNPVVVRRIAGQLARAGLIRVRRGPGGAVLARPASRISLQDVWEAVNPGSRPLLPLHPQSNPGCPVGRRVHAVLGEAFAVAEAAMRQSLAGITLDRLAAAL